MGAEKQRTRGRCRLVVSDQETYKMDQNATDGHFPETPKADWTDEKSWLGNPS